MNNFAVQYLNPAMGGLAFKPLPKVFCEVKVQTTTGTVTSTGFYFSTSDALLRTQQKIGCEASKITVRVVK